MLDLGMISTFFDNDPLYDAYTGDYLYDGQFATYDGSQLDGSFVRRRTVSLAPELVLPHRRVVMLFNEPWILSDPIRDGWLGEEVRQTMSARKGHGLFKIQPIDEVLGVTPSGTKGWEAYGFARWMKAIGDAQTTDLGAYFEFSFALTEPPMEGFFVADSTGRVWYIRLDTDVAEGFRVVHCDEIVTEAEISKAYRLVQVPGTIDPVEGTTGAPDEHPAIITERFRMYTKLDQAEANNYAGDKTLLVCTDFSTEAPITIDGEKWSVVASFPVLNGRALHIRRV